MFSYKILFIVFLAIAIGLPIVMFSIGKLNRESHNFTARKVNDTGYFTRYYQVNYRSVEEIYDYIQNLVSNYTFFCQLHTIGHTGRKGELPGYPIYMISLSSGFIKPSILVIAGVYANDWASVTSTLFLINQLLTKCETSGTLITSYNWKFIPILNPDGYNYSKSIPVGNHWIKNLARWSMDATGVNLNYNFATNWISNYNFREDTYPGIRSFSEKESQILRDYVMSMKGRIELAVILRSATKLFQRDRSYITYPWSHTTQKPEHWFIAQYLASLASSATNKELESNYQVMQSGNCEQNQTGTIDDWLFSAVGIKKVFIIQRNFKANLVYNPYDFITKLGAEVFSIIKIIATNVYKHPRDFKKMHEMMMMNDSIKDTNYILSKMIIK